MTHNHRNGLRTAQLAMAAFLASMPVTVHATSATATTADAQASVVVVEPVGAGFSFDVMNDAVSAVFLNGDAGDSVSLLMSRRKSAPQTAQRAAGGVVVMASGVYRIDMLQPTSGALRMMRGAIPGPVPRGSSILFLAQFN
ncbi:hypothetical protein [Novosphingobium sp. MMS21-SN21R]|uniref:hypothetical protein n=1 Tax=Novosphingobium sp. MMS21-SN21R TaxID=2969298 RepID=UPI002883B7D9|nr:hypothetical protein [Novosphingobium sp. MMS21-SN21R]MDT0507324.1 hypothetical protein [Novosphingobium sp. MMS21-SN21R]